MALERDARLELVRGLVRREALEDGLVEAARRLCESRETPGSRSRPKLGRFGEFFYEGRAVATVLIANAKTGRCSPGNRPKIIDFYTSLETVRKACGRRRRDDCRARRDGNARAESQRTAKHRRVLRKGSQSRVGAKLAAL